MNDKNYDIKYIQSLKDSNNIEELEKIREDGIKSLSLVSIDIPIENFKVSENIKISDINKYCYDLISKYSNDMIILNGKTYENDFLDTVSAINFDTMSEIDEPFGKTIERKLCNSYYEYSMTKTFDNIVNVELPNINNFYKKIIMKLFYDIKNNSTAIDIENMSIRLIEPLIRDYFKCKSYRTSRLKKGKLVNLELNGLLCVKAFIESNENYGGGLRYTLCDKNGLNIRNNDVHNLNESHGINLNRSKLLFVVILSIVHLTTL